MSIREDIIKAASAYLGKTEKPGNMGFVDPEFDRKMKAVGFQLTHAWCAYFAELIYKDAQVLPFDILDKLHSAGAVRTFANYKRMFPRAVSMVPSVGALAVWRQMVNGKPHPKGYGHIGIVEHPLGQAFITIDGNTNDGGGREGYIVAQKTRKLSDATRPHGLQLLGFIDPVVCRDIYMGLE